MPAPVMGYDAKAVVEEKHHLRVPIIGGQRPTMTEHDGLVRSPVLVEDLRSVFCRNRRHIESPCKFRLYLPLAYLALINDPGLFLHPNVAGDWPQYSRTQARSRSGFFSYPVDSTG